MTDQRLPLSPAARTSEIETRQFGVHVARADDVTLDSLPLVERFCQAGDVALLIARCAVTEIAALRAMEDLGFRLADTLVTWQHRLDPLPVDTSGVSIRPGTAADQDVIRGIATVAFTNYPGHYRADPRLDPAACDAGYVSWAERSCLLPEVAEAVLIAEIHAEVIGFITLRRAADGVGQAMVGGVLPQARGRGVYQSMLAHSLEWCKRQGCRRMIVSTQAANVPVQRVWLRLGYEPYRTEHTFHKWYDRPGSSKC